LHIGNGQFLHGDCLELMREIPDGSVDMVCTDPPYRVISGGTSSELAAGWSGSVLSKNDGKIFAHNDIEISSYMPALYRVLKPSGHAYVMTNNMNLRDLLNIAESCGFSFHNLLVWVKNTATANRWYMKNLEYTCLFYKKPAKRINNAGSKQTFNFDNPRNKRHPTEKPVELMRHYIENSSDPGQIVLDPFAGSGTTAISAENAGRRWTCIERDPTYYEAAIGRVFDHVASQ
jgi:site-specific DNA-methyltransferase (adenine-specific)